MSKVLQGDSNINENSHLNMVSFKDLNESAIAAANNSYSVILSDLESGQNTIEINTNM